MSQEKSTKTLNQAITFSTVRQFCQRHPAFNEGGVRAIIFNENTNGLAISGAIVRLGRKVLIHETLFLKWVSSHNSRTLSSSTEL